jgi:hypothetical protein
LTIKIEVIYCEEIIPPDQVTDVQVFTATGSTKSRSPQGASLGMEERLAQVRADKRTSLQGWIEVFLMEAEKRQAK